MRVRRYSDSLLDECAEFWWELYGNRPYVIRPDGYEAVNAPPVGPDMFRVRLGNALSGRFADHWKGEVSSDSVFLAEERGVLKGILICSVNRKEVIGYIRAGFMRRDVEGQQVADLLVNEALNYFRKVGLRRAVLGPSGSLEVESPMYIAGLEAGFTWDDNWEREVEEEGKEPVYVISADPGFGVFMGGSLEEFELRSEVKEKTEDLRKQGVTFERLTIDELRNLRRFDNREAPCWLNPDTIVTFAALVDGLVVGWLGHVGVCREEAGVMARVCGTYVIPAYRRKGIATILYHLATDAMVKHGARYGYDTTGVCSPARMIFHSIGYRYWYTGFGEMAKETG